MNKDNIISEKVTLISVVPFDFVTNDGSQIKGYNVHYFRDKKENENVFGKVYEKIYLPSDLSDKDKYEKLLYPKSATIDFEFISLSKKPRPVRINL